MVTVAASVVISVVVLLNLVATVMLARSNFETPLQKVLQLVLVWMVPCVGSIIVIAVLRGARSDYNPRFESGPASDVGLPATVPMSESFGGHHGGHGDAGGEAGHGGDVGGGGH
jgi:uncharacterized membrane protein YgcG